MAILEQDLASFVKLLALDNRRLLGLDVGSKKIGVALSDVSRVIASPMTIINRINIKKDLKAIMDIIQEFEITGLVLGFPLMMNGIEGQACINLRAFAAKLNDKCNIPIFFKDERLSTSAANRVLIESNIKRKKRNLLDDKIAACFILQGALDQININDHG